jgi:nicotinate-nucleotide adenylyltransferase
MASEIIPGITDLPPAPAGTRIGLFGGSFNPAHDGHRLVALQCLKRLQLDGIWTLVSPGNPLKDNDKLPALAHRVQSARKLLAHPRIAVTGFEAAHDFHYTADTLDYLLKARPGVRFVWIMGADSLASFDHWERWRDIARMLPIAVYARPGSGLRATRSKAAIALERYRLPEDAAETLAGREPPAWVYLRGVTSALSSTAIRQGLATHN